MPSRYLPIYLNDHLAGSTLGVELVRRTRRANEDGELGDFLRWLEGQIVEDRAALLALQRRHGIEPSLVKAGGAWVAEKLGRLKTNGHLISYSPLSRLLELEGLAGGIEAKLALWLALAEAGIDVEGLADRARQQRSRLEPFRLAAAREALSVAGAG
ncbi:MAG TPA: hypothetical protein VGK79_09785 [Gaiellaceae bacterium]